MEIQQFRVLYRLFLFRIVDLELLAADARGDANRLLGQFSGLLIFFSAALALGVLFADPARMSPAMAVRMVWSMEHFLIATTMLVAGLFAVLSWDSTFPDRRDVLVLAPLPVRTRTFFLAKVAAVAGALGLTVGSLNLVIGVAWPLALALPATHNPFELFVSLTFYRALLAYAVTMAAAAAFVLGSVLVVQGAAAQLLPRRWFVRLSAVLQMMALCVFVGTYFLQPSLASPEALMRPDNQAWLARLPSYWFFGFFHQWNGTMTPAMAPLARRAWVGLICAVLGAGAAFVLSYFRTIRRLVEQPDVLPRPRAARWLPRFGNALETALVHFSIRTLLRSRQHRVFLAFYWGAGFAVAVLFLKTPVSRQQLFAGPGGNPWHHASVPLLVSDIVMLCLASAGTRAVFSLPLELRANWLFRIAPLDGLRQPLAATRRSLWLLGVAPVWMASAVVLLAIWPWQQAAEHLAGLALLGAVLVEVGLSKFHKLPFTCSYLPGKSKIHLMFLAFVGLFSALVTWVAGAEMHALADPAQFVALVVTLVLTTLMLRWRNAGHVRSTGAELQFEESESPAVFALDLHCDGVTPLPVASELSSGTFEASRPVRTNSSSR